MFLLHLFSGAVASILASAPPHGAAPQAPPPAEAPAFRHGSITVFDPELARLIQDLARRSPTFAGALETISRGTLPMVVGAPDQVRRLLPSELRRRAPIAYAAAVHDHAGGLAGPRVRRVVVVVDLAAYARLYRGAPDAAAMSLDLEVILAHEIAGHAVGWSVSGRLLSGCLDPDPLTVATVPGVLGCAVERENAVRRELGVAERHAYGHLIYPSGRSHDAIEEAYSRGERSAS